MNQLRGAGAVVAAVVATVVLGAGPAQAAPAVGSRLPSGPRVVAAAQMFGLAPALSWTVVGGGGLLVLLLVGLLISRLSHHGRGDGEAERPPRSLRIVSLSCPHCSATRRPGAAYCTKCGLPQLT